MRSDSSKTSIGCSEISHSISLYHDGVVVVVVVVVEVEVVLVVVVVVVVVVEVTPLIMIFTDLVTYLYS
ncbi:hypothetical protein ElyMa_000972200 [Elysia marginata]|uniref:Uncharacterized protein n=1 Tax=Elysia marginata TaxID=1093978 RepID=A0AAV4HFC3_9GAST|nr:hypothetical protein ElyMa_000972200 [Elysia marginata]